MLSPLIFVVGKYYAAVGGASIGTKCYSWINTENRIALGRRAAVLTNRVGRRGHMLCHMVLLVSDAGRERLSGLRDFGTLRRLGRQ